MNQGKKIKRKPSQNDLESILNDPNLKGINMRRKEKITFKKGALQRPTVSLQENHKKGKKNP